MNDTPEAAVQIEGTEKLTEIAQYNLSNNKGNDEEEQQYEIEITRDKHSAIKKEIKTSNSPMTDYVKLSPNCNSPRQDQIRKITIHHMAGILTVESCGSWFSQPAAQASSNYGIDSAGRVARYVDENNRSWCSSSPANDNQAVTIEVSNSAAVTPWPVSDKAYSKLIDLCVDICKRNGIKELVYDGTSKGNLTTHDMFKQKVCPGPYLNEKMPYIAKEVTDRLKGFLVRVTAESLNIRSGAGTNYAIVDVIKDKGIYTILDTKTGQGANLWGLLKSGTGWISLDFTIRV